MRMRIPAMFAAGVFLITAGLILGPARAQSGNSIQDGAGKPIGKVVNVVGSTTIEHANAVVVQANVTTQRTKIGDPVYLGDIVQTGTDGRMGISFNDGTAFELSSNARMTLNNFVYDPDGKANSTFFSLAKGTFTFVAGKVAKDHNMTIDTPVATVGIRGTTPRIQISDDGSVKFTTLIEEGRTRVTKKLAAPVQPPVQEPNLNICRGC